MIEYKMPTGLEKEARQFMQEVLKFMDENLRDVDEGALNMLAYNYSTFIKATKDIQKTGVTVEFRGNVKPNPSIKIANDAQKLAMKVMEKFLLTPKDRRKIQTEDTDEESPLMEFVKNSKE